MPYCSRRKVFQNRPMRPLLLLLTMIATLHADPLQLTLRSRPKAGDAIQEKTVAWEPKKTAIIVCDMWDDHWCKSAARRVTELAGPMNDMLKVARAKGIFV